MQREPKASSLCINNMRVPACKNDSDLIMIYFLMFSLHWLCVFISFSCRLCLRKHVCSIHLLNGNFKCKEGIHNKVFKHSEELQHLFFRNILYNLILSVPVFCLSLSPPPLLALFISPFIANADSGGLSDSKQLWLVASTYFGPSEQSDAASRVFVGNVFRGGLCDGLS